MIFMRIPVNCSLAYPFSTQYSSYQVLALKLFMMNRKTLDLSLPTWYTMHKTLYNVQQCNLKEIAGHDLCALSFLDECVLNFVNTL